MSSKATDSAGKKDAAKSQVTEKSDSIPESTKPMSQERYFSKAGVHPFDQLKWDRRKATISDENGKVVFEQDDVEVPAGFSQLATKVVVSKYFYGELGTKEREKSFKELVHRVTRTISDWGYEDGLFDTQEAADVYYSELTWLCVNQYAAFNSPVWFNVGLHHVKGISGSKHNYYWDRKESQVKACANSYEYPQSSACFIQSVGDTMEDIMGLAVSEAMLFKHGSGTGTDMSSIRSSREKLSGGGMPSGPLSFMRVYDQIAAVVKSGGKTRRAAKMQSLKITHPDIKEFITCKTEEERKAWALIEQGYDGNYNGDAYGSIMFQNANLSIRVTDDFMDKAENDGEFQTIAVTTGEPVDSYNARELMDLIAQGTHICGDPGVQYDTTCNRWHTCPASGRINASNPCSEYMFIDDSACNLASLNLLKFRKDDGEFDIESFRRAVRILIIAQELIVDHGSYPTEQIARNSHDFRPLGLGYANLGALLMSLGLPYDSDEARAYAGAITAILTGTAYATSADLALSFGTFNEYDKNRDDMLKVIELHREAISDIDSQVCPESLLAAAKNSWDQALAQGNSNGFRNAQVSVLAPTGTIGFMMDCDTTGIEPDIALVKYKLLAGGGMLKIVNNTVSMALGKLGYSEDDINRIRRTIETDDTIETAKELDEKHLAVFDCAFKPANGERSIHYMAHIRMMAAAQPFLSGAISKTVNMPNDCTVKDIAGVYMEGWRIGLKAVAIYRDGSKRSQPLNTKKQGKEAKAAEAAAIEERIQQAADRPRRRRLQQTRSSITHKFEVGGHEGYLTVGLYEDGQPGELFITMAKEGSTVGGLMDAFGTCISLSLQYGVPLGTLVNKFSHSRFEPAGMTNNRDIPIAKSLIDYIARWLGITFLPGYREANTPKRPSASKSDNKNDNKSDGGNDGNDSDKSNSRVIGTVTSTVTENQRQVTLPPGRTDLNQISNRIDELIGIVSKPGDDAQAVEHQQKRQQMEGFNGQFSHFQADAPVCDNCGSITVRNGNCYRCYNCGASMGCS